MKSRNLEGTIQIEVLIFLMSALSFCVWCLDTPRYFYTLKINYTSPLRLRRYLLFRKGQEIFFPEKYSTVLMITLSQLIYFMVSIWGVYMTEKF